MSARQAFVPRPPSRVQSSDPDKHSADVRIRDGDKDMFVSGNGKARSISAFLGQKRSGNDTTLQGTGPTAGTGPGRTNTNTNKRSFEGILRPEMTPMSIIPYPTTTGPSAGAKQPGAGQTPRKTAGSGTFGFSRPMTPVSVQRGLKRGFQVGILAENQEDEESPNGNVHGNGFMFTGTEGEADVRAGAGPGTGGYMRMFEGSGGIRSAGGLQSSLERDIAAPVPGYALGGLGMNPESGEGCGIESILGRSSRSFGTMAEEEMGLERDVGLQRSLGGTKRGIHCEDLEQSGRYPDKSHQTQGSAKRMKQVRDPDEYIPISSPHIPPTPRPPASSVDCLLDPSLVVGSLFENIEEFVSLEQIEADWKRWKESSTEEWLSGADTLAQEYTDILNTIKDHLTDKVLAYANMVSSVEERRTEMSRNTETIHEKGKIIRENALKLGMKK